jgi:SAM-dependent methyltransferase
MSAHNIDDESLERVANEPWYVQTRASQKDRYRRAMRLAFFRGWRPGVVLDVGCANGQFAARLAAEGLSVVGYDINPARVAQNAAEYQEVPGLSFVHADFISELIEPESADLVCALEVIYYFKEAEEKRFFEKAWLTLKPGGRLLLSANIAFTAHYSEDSLLSRLGERFSPLCVERVYRNHYYRIELPLIELLDQIKYLENLRLFTPRILEAGRSFYPGVWNRLLLRPSWFMDRVALPVVRFVALKILESELLFRTVTFLSRWLSPQDGKSQIVVIAEKNISTEKASRPEPA